MDQLSFYQICIHVVIKGSIVSDMFTMAYDQILKIADCAFTGNAGNVSPTTDFT